MSVKQAVVAVCYCSSKSIMKALHVMKDRFPFQSFFQKGSDWSRDWSPLCNLFPLAKQPLGSLSAPCSAQGVPLAQLFLFLVPGWAQLPGLHAHAGSVFVCRVHYLDHSDLFPLESPIQTVKSLGRPCLLYMLIKVIRNSSGPVTARNYGKKWQGNKRKKKEKTHKGKKKHPIQNEPNCKTN